MSEFLFCISFTMILFHRRAVEELIKEGQEFVKKRDINYREPEKKAPTLKPNTRFLKRVITRNIFSNNSQRKTKRNTESGSSSSKSQENGDSKRLKKEKWMVRLYLHLHAMQYVTSRWFTKRKLKLVFVTFAAVSYGL